MNPCKNKLANLGSTSITIPIDTGTLHSHTSMNRDGTHTVVRVSETDRRELPAVPEETDEYRERATYLGYDDPLQMCQEHDIIHTMLADMLGLDVSPALLGAVCDEPINDLTGAEEDAVLAIQRFINIWRKHNAKET